jgi:Cu(I)/Ag(I) efflux system membrane fusion protein
VLGSFVTPEMDLYEIVDLSRVYVLADVSQRDIGHVGVGTAGRFWVSARPNEVVEAKVDLVYPTLNAEARTTRVRMQVRNPKLAFRPGEYGLVEFAQPARAALAVPRDAVIDTGTYTYVFVDDGGGHFTPRGVTLGAAPNDLIEIVTGLASGERVVSGATFLIDSESRLQGSLTQPAGSPGNGKTP